jgi:hypothetical protein
MCYVTMLQLSSEKITWNENDIYKWTITYNYIVIIPGFQDFVIGECFAYLCWIMYRMGT